MVIRLVLNNFECEAYRTDVYFTVGSIQTYFSTPNLFHVYPRVAENIVQYLPPN
jgi:hypothetical protein